MTLKRHSRTPSTLQDSASRLNSLAKSEKTRQDNCSLLAPERILEQLHVLIEVRINLVGREHRGKSLGQCGRVRLHVDAIRYPALGANNLLAALRQDEIDK